MPDDQEPREPVPLSQRHPPMGWIVSRFHRNLDALREIVDQFLPEFQEVDKQRIGSAAAGAIEAMPEEKQLAIWKYVGERLNEATPGDGVRKTNAWVPDPEVPTMQVTFDPKKLLQLFGGDRHHYSAFFKGLNRATSGPSRTMIMRNSLLAQAIGSFEVLISGIATRFFVEHPDALDEDKGVFTLAELRRFVDIDDAADELIARRVSALMRGSLDDWAIWFEKHCNAELPKLAMDWDGVRETFQRRHVIMHNGGLVSRHYLTQVKIEGSPPAIGDRLRVDDAYLHKAFDELDVLGTALGVMAWGTWYPADRNTSSGELLTRTYDLMVSKRWAVADALATRAARLKCDAAISEPIRCNGWLSRFELHGPESIREEVEAWDTSALAGQFQLVQDLLLQRFDAALDRLPDLVTTDGITLGELQAWPILKALREEERFADVYAGLVKDAPAYTDPPDCNGPMDPGQLPPPNQED